MEKGFEKISNYGLNAMICNIVFLASVLWYACEIDDCIMKEVSIDLFKEIIFFIIVIISFIGFLYYSIKFCYNFYKYEKEIEEKENVYKD